MRCTRCGIPMSKVPDFSNVMGRFAPEIQEFDQQISLLDTQRRNVLQQRSNAVLEEFHALVPEVEFGKSVVSHLHDRGGYRSKLIVRTGIVHGLKLSSSFSGTPKWILPIVHLTKLTKWDRDHYEENMDFAYNRRTTHNDYSSNIDLGDEFEIVGTVVRQGKYGLYEVKFL